MSVRNSEGGASVDEALDVPGDSDRWPELEVARDVGCDEYSGIPQPDSTPKASAVVTTAQSVLRITQF